jgi:hypothetical protein
MYTDRSLRKRKRVSYDINAMVKEERRQTHIAAKEARREKAIRETGKRRVQRQLRKEERRKERKAAKWTRDKKDALMADYKLLEELSIKNQGDFTYREIISEIYESYNYTFNNFNRFKKECLDEMKEWIDFYLKEEKNYKRVNGTSEQHTKIESLYSNLSDLLDTINEDTRVAISDKMNVFFTSLHIPTDENGDFELDIDTLSYNQCRQFINFLLECLVKVKMAKEKESYNNYRESIAKLNATIKKIKS